MLRKTMLPVVLVAALLAAAPPAAAQEPTISKTELRAVGGSDLWGVAVLEASGDRTTVSVTLAFPRRGPFHVRILAGTCAAPGRVAFELGATARAPDGADRAVATVDARLAALLGSQHAVRVDAPSGGVVACGDIALTAAARAAALRDALTGFMDARVERRAAAAMAWVTDELRARSPNLGVGTSNPCVYRYAVEALAQPSPTSATARVRSYTHFWPGDLAGGLPRSQAEVLDLVRTPAGWRVADVRAAGGEREEPGEPHGPTTSACNVGRRPAAWLPGVLPATGGPPAQVVPLAGVLGLGLVAAGLAVRRLRAVRSG